MVPFGKEEESEIVMKILITGGAGFIGHHLVEHFLKNSKCELVLLDRLDLSGNLNRLTDIGPWEKEKRRVKFVYHDLKSPINDFVRKAIGEVDWIFHLAACTHVDRSIEDPLSCVMDNVVGTVNLLDFAKYHNIEGFLYFSTDEVFGPAPHGKAFQEWDRYNSGNPYAASKAGAEEICLAYQNTYHLPLMITHTMNVFGERQHPEKFIPSTIKKLLRSETVLVHADETRTVSGSRFYIHARNVATAMNFLLDNPPPGWVGDKYNIVGEKEVDNLEMAKLIAQIVNKPLCYDLVDFHSSRPGHDLRYALDGTKMRNLGWKPAVDFENSLTRTVQWFLKHQEWL